MSTKIPTTDEAAELADFYDKLKDRRLPESLVHELTAIAARGWANGTYGH